jgi:hypothetical protein
VLEIGCGPLGGFVPALGRDGYDAVGIDPEAPERPVYHRVRFEQYQAPQPVECVVACISLHHVADLGDVLDRVTAALAPDGAVVVVEWAWERFDEATARWCFARLAPPAPAAGWFAQGSGGWTTSGHGCKGPRRTNLTSACGGVAVGPGQAGTKGEVCMRSVKDRLGVREASAEPVTVDDITVTPRSRALVVRLPKGGFVWNRPTAVLVEQDGQARRIPIVDVTRILQVGLLGLAVLAGSVGLLGIRRRTGGRA